MELKTLKLDPARLVMTSDPLDTARSINDREGLALLGDPLGNHNLPFDNTMTVAEALAEIASLRTAITALKTDLTNAVVHL